MIIFMALTTKEILAKNIQVLMDHKQWKQPELSKQSGVSQKTISNLLNRNYEGKPGLDVTEQIASAFGVEVWHLLIPNLPAELLQNKTLQKLIDCYKSASQEGRENTLRIAESEMRYNVIQQHNTNNTESQ